MKPRANPPDELAGESSGWPDEMLPWTGREVNVGASLDRVKVGQRRQGQAVTACRLVGGTDRTGIRDRNQMQMSVRAASRTQVASASPVLGNDRGSEDLLDASTHVLRGALHFA